MQYGKIERIEQRLATHGEDMTMHETEISLSYVRSSYSQDTGGGFICDVLFLDDGTILVIGEDSIVLYKDVEAWENDPSRQEGFIIRSQSQTA